MKTVIYLPQPIAILLHKVGICIQVIHFLEAQLFRSVCDNCSQYHACAFIASNLSN